MSDQIHHIIPVSAHDQSECEPAAPQIHDEEERPTTEGIDQPTIETSQNVSSVRNAILSSSNESNRIVRSIKQCTKLLKWFV